MVDLVEWSGGSGGKKNFVVLQSSIIKKQDNIGAPILDKLLTYWVKTQRCVALNTRFRPSHQGGSDDVVIDLSITLERSKKRIWDVNRGRTESGGKSR